MKEQYSTSRADQNTSIGQLFGLSWELAKQRQEIMLQARDRLRGLHNVDIREFEDFLNGLYLAENKNYTDVSTMVNDATSNFIASELSKIKVDDNDKEQPVKSSFYGQREHSTGIRVQTVDNRAKQLQSLLNSATYEFLEKNHKVIKAEVEQCINDMKALIGEDAILSNLSKTKQTLKYNENTASLINTFDTLYQTILSALGGNVGQIYGKAFERMLTAFNQLVNNYEDYTIQQIFAEKFKTAGDMSSVRGELETNVLTAHQTNNRTFSLTPDPTDKNQVVQITAFDERQGKMDVCFTMPGEYASNKQFRVSAKSWLGMAGHNFGETSLFNALTRTAGIDHTLAYGLVVGYYNPKQELWDSVQAHEFAKTCILLDTIMGFSQKNNWADTIVVQNRLDPKRPISVYSIRKLLQTPLKKLDPYISYDISSLNIRYVKKTEWWLKRLQTDMHQIKVSVGSGILQTQK